MYINNPQYNIKLVDLLDLYDIDFDYHDIYIKIKDWFNTDIKNVFFIEDDILYNIFIERFCDRFYNRCLNFDTYLEFKIKLKECLNRHRLEALQLYKASLIEINPLLTVDLKTVHDEDGMDKTNSTTHSTYTPNLTTHTTNDLTHGLRVDTTNEKFKDVTTDSGKDKTTNNGYDLHSDTPSSTMHVKDIANGSNNDYITDARNNHSTSDIEYGKKVTYDSDEKKTHNVNSGVDKTVNNVDSTGYSDTDNTLNTDLTKSLDYIHTQRGYQGSPVDLLTKYSTMVFDSITYLLDCIEDDKLFSSVLL